MYIGIYQLNFSLGVPCPTSSIVKSRNEYNFLLLASKIHLHLANDCVAKVVQHCLRNSVHYGVYPRSVFDENIRGLEGPKTPEISLAAPVKLSAVAALQTSSMSVENWQS